MAPHVTAPANEGTGVDPLYSATEDGRAPATLMEVLDHWSTSSADRIAYTFLRDGEVESGNLTYRELRQRAVALAARLTSLNAPGDRAILLYPQGLEFIVAFFGCLYAGVIAVPASIPNRKRGLEIVRRVAADSGAKWILSTGVLLEQLCEDMATDPTLGAVSCLDTEAWLDAVSGTWTRPVILPDALALLQYTSGSTGSPRGVAVTHANLMQNHRQIEASFDHDEKTVFVSWLPMFHDMGLGTVLQAVWLGGRCVLLAPRAFLQNPARWLRAISNYRATSSGGPDFAYDLCVRRIGEMERKGLDLASWRIAYNGSEPVRASTIERFAETFEPCGFRREAFHPVYGLAESTLFVSSEEATVPPFIQRFSARGLELGQGQPVPAHSGGQPLVGCGHPFLDTDLAIVNPENREACPAGRIGEIWIRGPAVAAGYWGKEAETEALFQATTADGRGPFLRTGDLGFMGDGHLFVTGRLKDLIIVRGLNHYPHDIEESVSTSHPGLVPHGAAAFSVEGAEKELLVIVQEVARIAMHSPETADMIRAIRRAASDNHGLSTHAVVLIKPSTLPRTTSGKVRHKDCREAFLKSALDEVASWVASTAIAEPPKAPTLERGRASARADDLIDWLRRHGADSVSACAGDGEQATMSLFRIFGNHGLLGMQVEAEYGGSGLGHFETARVLEQLAAIDFALSLLVGLNNSLGIQPIARHAQEKTKAQLLPGLVHGQELAAFALVEPSSGRSATTLTTRADGDGPGRFRLFGTKYLHCVAQGASVINVFARHEDPSSISAFVVASETEGIRQVRGLSVGVLGLTQDTIVLDGVPVGRENLLSNLGRGMDIARESMLFARLAIGAACIGGMKRCAQFVNRYGPHGKIDGKRTPNPVVLSRLGSVTARVTALECLVHRIARAIDAGQEMPREALAACRVLGPELLLRSVDDLMQLGVTGNHAENHRLACIYRDAGLLRNFDGPPEAVAELAGGLLMTGDASLRRLIEELFDAPDVVRFIDDVVGTVRLRMKTLRGTLAKRPERWGHTRAGELGIWLVLLAAVEGARHENPSGELERAHAWAQAQFEYALSSVRFGTPSETATVDASDVAATFASYARAIGEIDEALPVAEDAHRAPWAGFVALDTGTLIASLERPVPLEPGRKVVTVSPSLRFSRRELETWTVSWLARRLSMPASEIRLQSSFADHGVDSVAAVELAMDLSEKLGCRLDEALLWNFSTIEALVGWASTGTRQEETHFEADAILEAGVRPPSASAPPIEPHSVLLTGATGFLGAFLLYELLMQTQAHVCCLVRAPDPAGGADRIVKNLRRYGLWHDEFASRVHILPGNLAEPRLGLHAASFARLADEIDAIYNNGALLSFVAGYDDLRPSHVHATRELLRLASTSRPKTIHHVSSVAVYDASAYRGQTIAESTLVHESRGIHLPYSQCKWVTETLVWAAAARGIPVTVHRPAFIGGSSVNGAWNTADFLCRMLKAVVEMRALPGDLDVELDFSPVDYVSRSIVHLSRQAASLGRAFHLRHPRGMRLETFGQTLRSLGYDVDSIPYWEWVDRIAARKDGPLYPLLPFLRQRFPPEQLTYVELGQRAHRPRLECDETLRALRTAGIECPALDRELIGRYLEYLRAAGFMTSAPHGGLR